MQRDDLLVWMDLEMTSLVDVRRDSIIEVAVVLTDKELTIVAEGPDIVIHAPREAFDAIPENVRDIHERSGIIEPVIASSVSEKEAEQQVLAFLRENITPQSSPLCGNSIHMDRMFLYTRMPDVHSYLHYRNIDVSTIKELAKRWNPAVFSTYSKEGTHRAKDDILQSIDELKFWRGKVFR
jgi:oligoribonuclease